MLANPSHYVVQHSELPDYVAKRYSGWHVSAPVLAVLAIVAIVGTILANIVQSPALGPLLLVMAVLIIGAGGLCFASIVATGEVIEARFDKSTQIARLSYRGTFAHTEWAIPFRQISSVRMAARYNDHGRKVSVPTLDLTNGRQIVLPQSTNWSDIEAIRVMITKHVDEVAEAWARKSSNTALAYGRKPRR